MSLGTVLQVPWVAFTNWERDLATVKDHDFTVAAMELTPDAIDLDELARRKVGKLALVLETEGAGISAETLVIADLTVKVPIRTGVDSLNVAADSAVTFWELRR